MHDLPRLPGGLGGSPQLRPERDRDPRRRLAAASGIVSGADFRVSDAGATIDKEGAALAWNDDANQYLAVWGDNRYFETTFWDVYGKLVGG